MQRKQLKSLLAGVLFALFAFSSCVDNDYDLSKDMSLDVTIGAKGFSFPLGDSEEIKLSQLLKVEKSEVLKIVDNQFVIQKEDEIAGVNKRIDAVDIDIDIDRFDPITIGFVELPEGVPGVPIDEEKIFETEAYSETSFRVNQEITKDVEALHWVNFIEVDGEEPILNLILNIENRNNVQGTLTLADGFSVKFPSYIKFKNNPGLKYNADGSLDLSKVVIYPNGLTGDYTYSKPLLIESMDWGTDNNNIIIGEDGNRLVIPAEAVVLDGKVLATVGEGVSVNDLNRFSITPQAIMSTLHVGEVSGIIDPKIDLIEQSISLDLGEDLDFLTEENDTKLNLYNPQIKLSLSNNVRVPIVLEGLTLEALDKSGSILASVPVEPLTLDAADENGTAKITNFYLSRQGSAAALYKTVKVERLAELMAVVPDRIELRVQPKTTGDNHVVDLNKDIIIEGSYDVFVPLEFESLEITYSDVMDGLKKDLEDVTEELLDTKLDIVATIGNTIPLPFEIDGSELKAVNEYGRELDDVKVTVKEGNYISAGKMVNGVATEVETTLTISLESEGKSLRDLDGLELVVKSVTPPSSGSLPLRSDQYFQMRDVKIVIQNDLNFNLN